MLEKPVVTAERMSVMKVHQHKEVRQGSRAVFGRSLRHTNTACQYEEAHLTASLDETAMNVSFPRTGSDVRP